MVQAKAGALKTGNGRNSLVEVAYSELYRRIVTLELEPGHGLEEGPLMEALEIGRTPLREAMQRLVADMLVEAQPGKGFVVRPLTLQNTKAAFAALQVLECGVADLAVRQDAGVFIKQMQQVNQEVKQAVKSMDIYRLVEANSRFHDTYARCCHNPYLVQALQKVRCETNRLAYLSYGNQIDPRRSLKDHYASVIDQHERIIQALVARDHAALKKVIVEHIEIFKGRIVQYLADF